MKVSEIFNSIEGEGKRVGLPSTFIRLFGCNLRCSYCDSMYSIEGTDYTEMSVDDIIAKVEKIGCKNVTLTGGEPLIHKDVNNLLIKLALSDYKVNVETNGTIIPNVRHDNIFYTVDFKTYSSGVSDKMNEAVFASLHEEDVIKCVCGSLVDLSQSLDFLRGMGLQNFSNIYISPVFGQIEPEILVEFVKSHELWNWKVQLQIHKIIWNPQERGV